MSAETAVPLPILGKMLLHDGRTGELFDHPVTVGVIYMMKLAHLVEVVHVEAIAYSDVETEVPVRRRRGLVLERGVREREQAVVAYHPRPFQDPDLQRAIAPVGIFGRGEFSHTGVGRICFRVPVAGMEHQGVGGGEGQLAEVLVPFFAVVRHLAVHVAAVLSVLRRPVVRHEEVEHLGQDRTAQVGRQPVVVGIVGLLGLASDGAGHAVGLDLVVDLAAELVGPGLADGVDQEACRRHK